MLEELQIVVKSLDISKFHIIGITAEIERLADIGELIHDMCFGLKFILIPTNKVGVVDVHSLTDDQVRILKEQLK